MTRRGIGWTVAAVAAVVALAVVVLRPPSADRFRDYVAAMRSEREQTSPAESWGPNPPDSENAATLIASELAALEATLPPRSAWPCLTDAPLCMTPPQLSSAEESAAEQFVERLVPLTARVNEALARPRCRFVDVDCPNDSTRITQLTPCWDTVSVLMAIVWHARSPDDRLSACRAVLTIGVRMERVDDRNDYLVPDLIRMPLAALRHGIEGGTADPRRARPLMEDALRTDFLGRMSGRLSEHRIGAVTHHENLLDADARLSVVARMRNWWYSSDGERQQDQTSDAVIAAAEALKDLAGTPTSSYPQWVSATKRLVRSRGVSELYAELLVGEPFALTDATTRLARVALAAAEHRATHGDFPASLDELKPMFPDGVPLDPFTDAPFVYERTVTGVRIASAGRLAAGPPLDEETLRERCLVWELKR